MKKSIFLLCSLTLILIIITCISSIAQDEEQKKQPSKEQINKFIDEWLDSPIRYIITSEESKAFKKLKNREDKVRFINYFWLRRDPNPRTRVNEYKTEFYNRVATSNYRFKIGKKEGWKSQRGQIFIVFGPTNEIHTGLTSSLRSYEIWTYYRLPSKRIPSYYSIVFIDMTGNRDYRIAIADYAGRSSFERMLDQYRYIPRAGYIPPELVSAMEDMKKKAIVNKDIELKDAPTSVEISSNLPFRFFSTYFQADKSETQLLFGFGFQYKDIGFKEKEGEKLSPSINLEATLIDKENNPVETFKQNVSFSIEPKELEKKVDESFIFWRSIKARPGDYLIRIRVEDEMSGAQSIWKKELSIPSFKDNETLLTNSILANEIKQVGQVEGTAEMVDTILLKGYQIKPNMKAIYYTSSRLCFFSQLINPQLLSESPKSQMEINAYIAKDDKIFQNIQLPDTAFSSSKQDEILIYYCLPLTDFPAGEYSLAIVAVNKEMDKEVTRITTFKVIEKNSQD